MVHKVEPFTEVWEENSNVSATSVKYFQNSVHKEDKSLSCRTSIKGKLLIVQFVKHTGNQRLGRKSFKYCGYRRGQWDGSQVIFKGLWRYDKCFHKVFKNLYFSSFQLQNWIALAQVHQQYVQGLVIFWFRKMTFLFVFTCDLRTVTRDLRTGTWALWPVAWDVTLLTCPWTCRLWGQMF